MRTFLIVVFLIAAIPAMLGAAFQLSFGLFVVEETKARASRIASADRMDVEGAWGETGLPQQSFIAHINPDDMANLRDVRVASFVPIERIFNSAEGSSSKSSVMLRARIFAEEECALLLETIAKKCRVFNVLKAGRVSRKKFAMLVQYDFTQKAAVGEYDSDSPLRMETFTGEMKLNSSSREARKAAYNSVAKECAEFRRRYGNCSIYAVGIDSALKFTPSLHYSLTFLVPRGFELAKG